MGNVAIDNKFVILSRVGSDIRVESVGNVPNVNNVGRTGPTVAKRGGNSNVSPPHNT